MTDENNLQQPSKASTLVLKSSDGEEFTLKAVSNEVENQLAIFGSKIGAWVLIICACLVGALVILLFLQTFNLNKTPTSFSAPFCSSESGTSCKTTAQVLADWNSADLGGIDAARVALEYDAQLLRTKRAQSLVSARLFIWSIAILAGISQLTMGSAFIFARIRSSSPETFGMESEGGRKAYLSTLYPGVILAAFGAIIICGALYASTRTTYRTDDMPVYLDWPKGMRSHFDSLEREKKAKQAVADKVGITEEEKDFLEKLEASLANGQDTANQQEGK